jgi:hypothetical protein
VGRSAARVASRSLAGIGRRLAYATFSNVLNSILRNFLLNEMCVQSSVIRSYTYIYRSAIFAITHFKGCAIL